MANADKIVWVDAAAAETTLHDPDSPTMALAVMLGMTGTLMPVSSMVEDVIPLQPGARLRRVNVHPRVVDLPILVSAATASALRTSIRTLLYAFDPTRGDGALKVTAPDTSVRRLTCRYAGGMEGDTGQDREGRYWAKFVASFRASDPYWYASSATTASYELAEASTFFPFFPLTLMTSGLFASATINNTGDVETWPVWTITGPFDNPIIRNATTDEEISLTIDLDAGEYVVIDTRPGAKTITDNLGANQFSTLADDSVLWSLAVGNNSIQIEGTSTSVDSQVDVSYTLRYRSA